MVNHHFEIGCESYEMRHMLFSIRSGDDLELPRIGILVLIQGIRQHMFHRLPTYISVPTGTLLTWAVAVPHEVYADGGGNGGAGNTFPEYVINSNKPVVKGF